MAYCIERVALIISGDFQATFGDHGGAAWGETRRVARRGTARGKESNREQGAPDGGAARVTASPSSDADREGIPTARREASRPISMLRWRRQTHAFDETGSHATPNAPGDSSTGTDGDVARGATATPGVQGERAEKPVIIRGSKTAPVVLPGDGERERKGIRSTAGRVVLIAAIAATLFASLAVVVPAGAGAGLPAVLTSYANAMPWSAPTATPRPASSGTSAGVTTNVSGGSPSQQAIIADIQSVFGPYASGALNVARCESSLDSHAWNPTPVLGSHASGVFQILYPATWNGTSYRSYSPYDEWANVRAAYEIFKRDGYSWREWQCKP